MVCPSTINKVREYLQNYMKTIDYTALIHYINSWLAYVGTSSRNGRLNTLGHFEKKAYNILLWLQPYQSAGMPCNSIHCYQRGSQNYLIGWAGQFNETTSVN